MSQGPPRMGAFGSQSFNFNNSSYGRSKVQDPTKVFNLYVSLEDIMRGNQITIQISRSVEQADGSTRKEEKMLTVNVKPGWKAGTKITFPREGNQGLNKIPADIDIIIRDKPHPLFKREDNDIRCTISISLKQALCGIEILVPTLDNKLVPFTLTSEVINPTTTKRLQGYGLPFVKEPSRRGDLIISFDIKFPKEVSSSVRQILYNTLQ